MPLNLRDVKWQYWVGGVGGAGVVYYVYKRQSAKAAAPDMTATDPTIDPNTGLPYSAESGYSSAPSGTTPSLYSYYDPASGTYVNTGIGSPTTAPTTPGTAIAWVQQATAYLIQQGFDATLVITALGKYIGGQPLSPAEHDVVLAARAAEGEVPGGAPPIQTVPPAGQPAKAQYAVQLHRIGAAPGGRALVQTYSVPGATPVEIEVALRKTGSDVRNARYMPYYVSHGGKFPPQAAVYTTVVSKA